MRTVPLPLTFVLAPDCGPFTNGPLPARYMSLLQLLWFTTQSTKTLFTLWLCLKSKESKEYNFLWNINPIVPWFQSIFPASFPCSPARFAHDLLKCHQCFCLWVFAHTICLLLTTIPVNLWASWTRFHPPNSSSRSTSFWIGLPYQKERVFLLGPHRIFCHLGPNTRYIFITLIFFCPIW